MKKLNIWTTLFSEIGYELILNKIKIVLNWSKLGNLKALRGFLGLTRYYNRFIKCYNAVVSNLTKLLKKKLFS